MKNYAIGVIPARYGATRLPGKPLLDIHGKPMIQWVYENAIKVHGLTQVVVATDDERIKNTVQGFGGRVVMTSPDLLSGTDRVAAVSREIEAEIYVNIQGDEPLMEPQVIEETLQLVSSGWFTMGTAMTALSGVDELHNPSVVKVLPDYFNRAIYFSRLAIPYSRTEPPADAANWVVRKHLGIYVYRHDVLQKISAMPPGQLEKAEVLEQLRAVEAGIGIGIAEVQSRSMGVDTLEDLEKVKALLK